VSTLDNLKKEAKRRLKALRADSAADRPSLRDVQHALAREHGHESWRAMVEAVAREQAAPSPRGDRARAEIVAAFLEFACWDHHVHGKGDHWRRDRAASRLLAQHPEIACDSIYPSVVCGERDEVDRLIAANPEVARTSGGPRGWTPLLYLCYTRFTHQPAIANAVHIGRMLLDAGANPNDFYMAGSVRYSALVGAAGEGEQDSPRQPQGAALFELLLERGAEPFDIQVLYNTHFHGDVLWWLDLIWKHTEGTVRAAAWADPEWRMLDMGNYGTGARFLVELAEQKDNDRLRQWLVEHGARPTSTARVPRRIAERDPFIAACLRLDRDDVSRQLAAHPEYLGSTGAMFAAAARGRADIVAWLLDLGVPIEVADETKQRTLHVAAAANAVSVGRLLIERGAEIDARETRFNAAPIGFAAHYNHTEMMDLLAPRSREVFNLCANGYVDRLREVLEADSNRAASLGDGMTLLFWLPDDETKALAAIDLLLAHGADPSARNNRGQTAADVVEERGLLAAGARLRSVERSVPRVPHEQVDVYDGLAHDLVLAYDSGSEPALQRLRTYYGIALTWDQLRAGVRDRMAAIPEDELPDAPLIDPYFALPQARLLVARQAGYQTWEALVQAQA
jgi:ankyrin repeat protein